MEQRHVFTFEPSHTLPYTQADTQEPEKTLSWYAYTVNAFFTISGYAKKLIFSALQKKEPEKVVEDDLESGKRSPKSPLRTMQKETWTYGPTM